MTRPDNRLASGTFLQVLLVEDSPGDVRLTRDAFVDANDKVNLSVAVDGAEAMAFLRHEGDYATPRTPI
jgi:chemotaxis family two-component system response regulator Rcp1